MNYSMTILDIMRGINNMKILYLTNIPVPYRVDFFNELGKYCDLTVLYEKKLSKDRNSKWLDNVGENYKEEYIGGVDIGKDNRLSFKIIKWLNKKYDIIIIGGYSTALGILAISYLKLKRIPFVLNTDGGFIKNDNNVKFFIKKQLISSASHWLSTGSKTTKYLSHYGANIKYIYEYPFTSIRKADILNKPLKLEEKILIRRELDLELRNIVLMVGRIIDLKGIDIILKSARNLPNYNFYIVGGEAKDKHLKMMSDLQLSNVHFEGFKSRAELKKYYHASDVFILPTRDDIWGLVINEAMACGLPIITTEKCIAGLELVSNDENGNVIPIDNSNELSIKLETILSNDDMRKRMSSRSIEIIRSYTIENMARVHMEIFRAICRE